MAIAIVDDGRLIYSNAFGRLSLDAPLAVASLSKPIFAFAVLKLTELGLLSLDRPLAEYLPQPYIDGEPRLSLITVRHVLSHTSGFPNWRDESGLRMLSRPGTAFHYSTEGLIYLQTVVEHLLGQTIDQHLAQKVFEPFGMISSRLLPEDLSQFLPFLPTEARAYGALSLHTTVNDYARFLVEMFRTEPRDEYHLAPATLSAMLTPQIRVGSQPALSWGLGWGLQHVHGEVDSFWQWGARRDITRSIVIGVPATQSAVVIFTDHPDGLTICEEIAQVALEYPESFPAFRWLLPAEKWHADGSINP
jgi:CubicO group peptidase (beta-lactamase class C family)